MQTIYIGFELEGCIKDNYRNLLRKELSKLHKNIRLGHDFSVRVKSGFDDVEIKTPKLKLDKGWELLEYILSVLYLFTELKLFYTNSSCGLHVNLSVKTTCKKLERIYFKTIYLFNEYYIAKRFKRARNYYCERIFQKNEKNRFDYLINNFSEFVYQKNRTCAFRKSRIEFRTIGNKDYHLRYQVLRTSIAHMVEVFSNSLRPVQFRI